jgi:hypothetical protein
VSRTGGIKGSRYYGRYVLIGETPFEEPDLRRWGDWFERATRDGSRQIGNDKVGEATISTVFLGIDHNYYSDGLPVLFETMIFGGDLDNHTERWRSYREALRGHEMIVHAMRTGLPMPDFGP